MKEMEQQKVDPTNPNHKLGRWDPPQILGIFMGFLNIILEFSVRQS